MRASSASTSSGTRAASSPPPMSPSIRIAPRPTGTMPPSSQSRFASSTARRTTTTRSRPASASSAASRTKADGELTEYPKAEHGFDNPLAPNPARPATNDQSVRECTIREADGGTLVNDATKASFTYKDECVRLGPLVGHDPEATQAATVAVTGFLKSVLRP